MRGVYGWMIAQLVAVLGLILLVRQGMDFAIDRTLGATNEALLDASDGLGGGILGGGGGGGGGLVDASTDGHGAAGRANQEIHPDLAEAGQVVLRDGKLGVLVATDDPSEPERWVPLDGSDPDELPWLLRDESGRWLVSTAAGGSVFLALLGLQLAFRKPEETDEDEEDGAEEVQWIQEDR